MSAVSSKKLPGALPGFFHFSSKQRATHSHLSPRLLQIPGALLRNQKDHPMLSKATLALIVSEIVAGYAKVIRVKGKLKVVGSR